MPPPRPGSQNGALASRSMKRERRRLRESGGREDLPDEPVPGNLRRRRGLRRGERGKRGRQTIEAVVAPDLLDEVRFARDIDAEARNRHHPGGPAICIGGGFRDAEAESGQNPRDIVARHGLAEQPGDARRSQPHLRERPRRGIAIDERLRAACRRRSAAKRRRRAGDAERRGSDVAAALEADRRLRLQPEPLARAADRRRMKVGALEGDEPRRGADLRIVTAHHAADRARVLGVGNHEHVRLERAVGAVERADALAGTRAPDDERAPRQPLEVERVHRLSELEHHVVGDVDDVADRADAGRGQAVGEPLGRGARPRSRTPARSSAGRGRAPRGGRPVLRPRLPAGPAAGTVRSGICSGRPQIDGRLTRQADVAEAVGAIRGDLEVDDRESARFDRRHFESAQADLVRDGLGCARDADEVAQPGVDEPHSGNCSRKRRSFS